MLFSGSTSRHELLGSARAHGHDFEFLSKPVHPDTLLQRLSDAGVTGRAA